MSIETEIKRIKDNIAASYTALSEKGAELPDVQNSRNLAATINDIPKSEGGALVYATNTVGHQLQSGEKVFLNNYQAFSAQNYPELHSNYESRHCSFFRNNKLYICNDNVHYFEYKPKNDRWQKISQYNLSFPSYMVLDWIDDNLYILDMNGYSNYALIPPYRGQLPDMHTYIGYAVIDNIKTHYCIRQQDSNFYLYEFDAKTWKTIGDPLKNLYTGNIDTYSGNLRAFIFKTKLIAVFNKDIYIYDLTTMTLLGQSKFTNSTYTYYATGAETGDYLICKNGNHNYQNINNNALVLYRLQDDYTYKPEIVPLLKKYTSRNCCVIYDSRSHLLNIGTTQSAWLYRFNPDTKQFVSIDFTCPTISNVENPFCYNMSVSPDLCFVNIGAKHDYYNHSYVYRLQTTEDDYFAESLTEENCYADRTLLGFATGNQSPDGKYEIKTLLPDTVNINFNVTPATENIEIKGGVK